MRDTLSDRPMKLTEIATAAGVSVPTVSKVINGRSDVAPATRERVERVIEASGYVVNRAGRVHRDKRSKHIDFVVQGLYSYHTFQILRGVEDALASSDVRVVLASTHDHQQRERQWVQRLAEGSTDGVVLVLADGGSAHLQELRVRGIPFVVVDRLGELGPDDLSVTATNWEGGKAATEYLLALGHRRIAALLGPADFPCNQDRLAGYRAALETAGLAVDPELIRHGSWHVEPTHTEMLALSSLPEPPTAIFVGNDEQAFGVYRAVNERGLRVPDQLSVVGFDDMPYAAWMTPALTTIRQPLTEMGRVATNMLLRLIAGEPVDNIRVSLSTPLVRRESCAPPDGSR